MSLSFARICFGLVLGTSAIEAQTPVPPDVPRCQGARDSVVVLWCQGGEAWLRQDTKTAIARYARVYAMEQAKRTLSPAAWRVLVDNLGMGYGMSGALDKSQEVFEYGISNDSEYPLFRYNMACVYAERGDWQTAIRYLDEAYARKANMTRGEQMPNAWTDDSFQRFMKDRAFTAALAKITPKVP